MIFKMKKEELYLHASKIALNNSKLIYDEANLLSNENHPARAFALTIISLEESAKAFLLRLISLNIVEEKKTMDFVRNHDNKLLQSSKILSFSMKIADVILDLIKMSETEGRIPKVPEWDNYKINVKAWAELFDKVSKFHKIKLDSFYVDVRGDEIIDPNTKFEKNPASEILGMADLQITIIKALIDLKDYEFFNMWTEPFVSQIKIDNLLK